MAEAGVSRGIKAPFQKEWYKKKSTQKWIFVVIAISPSYLGYILFNLYPNALGFYYALINWDGITEKTFVGLHNFTILFTDERVWLAFWHTFLLMITITPIVILVSVVMSYLLTHKKYRANEFFKVLFFFPNIISTVVVAIVWSFIYNGPYGLFNWFLRIFGIPIGDYYWLGDKATAIWALVPPHVWALAGLYIVIFSNAMKTIPSSLYESAILDGASPMRRLWSITVPLINPIVRFATIFIVIGLFKGFEQVLLLTNGGPAGHTNVIGLYMFNMAFGDEYHRFGYASAIGMVLFVVLVLAKVAIDKFLPSNEIEY